jgi:hypothetical protein
VRAAADTSPVGTPPVQVFLLLGLCVPLVLPTFMDRYRQRRGLAAPPSAPASQASSSASTIQAVTQAGQDALTPLAAAMALATRELDRAEERARRAEIQVNRLHREKATDSATIARVKSERDDCQQERTQLLRERGAL